MPLLPPTPTAIQPSTAVIVPIYDINLSGGSSRFDTSPYLVTPCLVKLLGNQGYEFYLAQTEEARYLKEILSDYVKFPTFPRSLNGDVIVDYHPEYLPNTLQESDTNIISNVFLAIFGNYASKLQNGKPVWLEDGLGTCFTMIHFQQAMNSIIPGITLRSVHYSDDILPIQAAFENELGQATCTERDFIKKILEDQANHFMFLRRFKIMWLMINAIKNGFVEFRAMIYGGHPGRYWSGLLEEAPFLAISHFNSLGRSVIFKLTLIKSPHFCAVIHENSNYSQHNYSQRLHMDSAVAEFLGVLECSYFRDTDFPKYHFGQEGFNPMLRFFGEWSKDERISTKMSSLSMENVPSYVSSYFIRWSANIIEYVSTIGNQICLRDLTIQHLASFYGHRGGKGNLGKRRVFSSRPVQDVKWRDNLASANTFIDTEGRMPSNKADDVEERRLGCWIARYKSKEKGTNSERDQLMRREIPLAFVDNSHPVQDVKWCGNLTSAKTFIDTEERMPSDKVGDVEERRLGRWIAKYKSSEKGTNSERDQLMRTEIPLAFANQLTLMRREIPLAFVDNSRPVQDVKWRDNLASAKTFIDTEGRMPSKKVGDVEERRLGRWIDNNKSKEKGTNSERDQLMRTEIPLAFPNQ